MFQVVFKCQYEKKIYLETPIFDNVSITWWMFHLHHIKYSHKILNDKWLLLRDFWVCESEFFVCSFLKTLIQSLYLIWRQTLRRGHLQNHRWGVKAVLKICNSKLISSVWNTNANRQVVSERQRGSLKLYRSIYSMRESIYSHLFMSYSLWAIWHEWLVGDVLYFWQSFECLLSTSSDITMCFRLMLSLSKS